MAHFSEKGKQIVLRQLTKLKERYLFKSIAYPMGQLVHLTGCGISQPLEIYGWCACTCGLLGDIHWMDIAVGEKVFPSFDKDYSRQERQGKPMSEEERIECRRILCETFGTAWLKPKPPDEQATFNAEEWSIIEEVFGKEVTDIMRQRYESSTESAFA